MNLRTLLATLALGLALATGTAALADTAGPALGTLPASFPVSSCDDTKHCWHGWGLAPYGSSTADVLLPPKLNKFLADAQKAGMPPELVAFVTNDLQKYPQGHLTDPQYMPPGMHLDLMESRDGPMFDVVVGAKRLGKGKVEAATTIRHVYAYKGVLWVVEDPGACDNLSLWHMALPAPTLRVAQAPVHPDCVEIDFVLPPHTVGVAFAAWGPEQLPPSHCPSAHPSARCQADCEATFEAEADRIYHRDGIDHTWKHVAAYGVQDQATLMSDSLIGTAYVTQGGYAVSVCIDVRDPVTGQIHHSVPKTIAWNGPTKRRRWLLTQDDWQLAD